MMVITEGALTFTFPAGWEASKFDEWAFYRRQFSRLSGLRATCGAKNCGAELTCVACGKPASTGTKAIDILAIEQKSCCWCIEIKDYRLGRRTKTVDLADEVAIKVRDSLAGLAAAAAAANANDESAKNQAISALACRRFRVVLHLEQPAKHSKLVRRAINPANVQLRLRQLVKGIDPHALVVETTRMNGVTWTVTQEKGR